VGLLIFLILHQIWIVPIWYILPIGAPIAVAGWGSRGRVGL
jgi:hypothetical protein